jgi:hypothetical protein
MSLDIDYFTCSTELVHSKRSFFWIYLYLKEKTFFVRSFKTSIEQKHKHPDLRNVTKKRKVTSK